MKVLRSAETPTANWCRSFSSNTRQNPRQRIFPIEIDAGANTVAQEIRLGEAQFDAARILTVAQSGAGVLSATEQIGFCDTDFADKPSALEYPPATAKFPVDFSSTSILSTTRSGAEPDLGNLDLLEIIQVVKTTLGAINQRTIIRVAFANIEFPANDIISRARVLPRILMRSI